MVKDVVSLGFLVITKCAILIKSDRLLTATTLPLVTTTRATRLTGTRTNTPQTTQSLSVTTIPSCPLSSLLVRILRRVLARARRPLRPRAVASHHLHLLLLLNRRPFLVFLAVVRASPAVTLVVALHLLAAVVRRAHQAPRTQAPLQEDPARSRRVWRLAVAPTMVAEWSQAALLHLWPSLLLP